MKIESSGRIMVRVQRAQFQAITAAATLRAPSSGPTTRPLFGASHAASLTFNAHAAPQQQQEWLLHEPNHSELHPWDVAHLVAQGKLPGSEQFAAGQPTYAEPDLLNTRQIPDRRAKTASARASGAGAPAGPPWQPIDTLNTNYDPKAGATFSPAWHLESAYANFIGAWAYNKGAGVRIAHLDTGYTPGHMSTPRNMVPEQGYNFYENNTNTADPYMTGTGFMPGHGTATLALLAGNAVDIEYQAGPIYNGDLGGAPDASVIPVRIGPSVIHLYSADVAQGLDYALAPRGGGICDVVSLSHGGLPSNAWAAAVNRLYDAGVVVVAAAGDSFYLKVMDVATHFTVYPSAFYRVITATGATYDKGAYVTSNFGAMQGCWGPDAVMRKALAAYTPNVPWMAYQNNPSGWDMDGGGTSASTPQIAAACALWLKQYGPLFPAGWQRVEACRHALFESVKNRGANSSQIGIGLLDAAEMLSPATLARVQAAYAARQLPYAPPDAVSFPFFRLLFGLPPPGPGVDEMYDTEAAQIFFRSDNADLAAAVEANPEGDSAKALPEADATKLRNAFIAERSMSNTLRSYLQAQITSLNSSAKAMSAGAARKTSPQGGSSVPSRQRKFNFGWVRDLPDHRDFAFTPSVASMTALPPSVDLRPQIPFPPYDQGQIGSCTGNAIAAAVQFDRLKNRQNPDFVPSRLFVYYNERAMEGTIAMDAGAQIRDGIKSVANLGVCPETDWPYDATPADPSTHLFPPNVPADTPPAAAAVAAAANHKALSYFSLAQNLAQLKGCLADGYPFVFGFSVYTNIYGGDGNPVTILSLPGPNDTIEGGHAVVAVGYDDEKQLFTIRNSWGTSVQDQGYFYMPYAYLLDSNLSDDFWTVRGVSG